MFLEAYNSTSYFLTIHLLNGLFRRFFILKLYHSTAVAIPGLVGIEYASYYITEFDETIKDLFVSCDKIYVLYEYHCLFIFYIIIAPTLLWGS